MTAATKMEIENAARAALSERRGDAGEASLKAIERLARLLEEVIPRLPDAISERETGRDGIVQLPAGEMDDDTVHEDGSVSPRVLAALAEVHSVLSAKSAATLASLFRAVSESRADEGDETDVQHTRVLDRGRELGVRAIPVNPDVRIGPVGKLLVKILESYPKKAEIVITSALRNEPGSHHGGLTYRGSPTAALDIAARGKDAARKMRDVAKWLYDKFAAETVELIHTTPFNTDRGFYVWHQRKYPGGGPIYDPKTRGEHRDHVHFATSKALAGKILARLGQ